MAWCRIPAIALLRPGRGWVRDAEPGLPDLEPPDPEPLDPLLELHADPALDAEPAAEC